MDNLQKIINNKLLSAIKARDAERVKILLECGADHTFISASGLTPLMTAATLNAANIIDIFHEAGKLGNINVQDRSGRTALHYAGVCRSEKAITTLLSNGADPTIKDKDGTSAFTYLLWYINADTLISNYLKDIGKGNLHISEFSHQHAEKKPELKKWVLETMRSAEWNGVNR